MKPRTRIAAVSFLVLLATAFALGIGFLITWGGRVEALLLVFGDRVWVTVDAGRPRVFLLLTLPGVLFWAAYSVYLRRSGE